MNNFLLFNDIDKLSLEEVDMIIESLETYISTYTQLLPQPVNISKRFNVKVFKSNRPAEIESELEIEEKIEEALKLRDKMNILRSMLEMESVVEEEKHTNNFFKDIINLLKEKILGLRKSKVNNI